MLKYLITGVRGSIGRELSQRLKASRCGTVIGVDHRPLTSHFLDQYIQADLCDIPTVNQMVDRVRPDVVFHLAGSSSSDFEISHRANVLSTWTLLDAIAKAKIPVKAIVLASSAAVYGTSRTEPLSEQDIPMPESAYGVTKLFEEQVGTHFCQRHGLPVMSARIFNLLGPAIKTDLFIGNLFSQLKKLLEGSLEQINLGGIDDTRDYIDVRDVVSGLLQIARSGTGGQHYNLGSGKGITPRSIIDHTLGLTKITWDRVVARTVTSVPKTNQSVAVIQRLSALGWAPRLSLSESISYVLSKLQGEES